MRIDKKFKDSRCNSLNKDAQIFCVIEEKKGLQLQCVLDSVGLGLELFVSKSPGGRGLHDKVDGPLRAHLWLGWVRPPSQSKLIIA